MDDVAYKGFEKELDLGQKSLDSVLKGGEKAGAGWAAATRREPERATRSGRRRGPCGTARVAEGEGSRASAAWCGCRTNGRSSSGCIRSLRTSIRREKGLRLSFSFTGMNPSSRDG